MREHMGWALHRAKRSWDSIDGPRVVIVGGGFGGLAAARALKHASTVEGTDVGLPAQIVLIDRANHYLFQPLLYQVATSVLTPGQIGSPLRGLLRKQKNAAVFLGEITGVDKERKLVFGNSPDREGLSIAYDYLILATGSTHSYFGHPEFEKFAPGLKTLADAVGIRNRILLAFEQAETEEDPTRHRALLTFVLVGAGPTGVEMAGALAILVRNTLQTEFRRVDPSSARIVLVDMAPRVLGTFAEELSRRVKTRLEKLGVEVRLGHGVDQIDDAGVVVAGERIASKTVIWTAGVAPSPAGKWLGVETDRAGRVRVQNDLTVPGHPEIFVIGDTASLDQDGKPLPGVAQVAMQQGRYAGSVIRRRLAGQSSPGPFRYFDKGTMALVGQGYAVLQRGKVKMSGPLVFLVWLAVHVLFLPQWGPRVIVIFQWLWTFLTRQRGSRLIVNHHRADERGQEQRPQEGLGHREAPSAPATERAAAPGAIGAAAPVVPPA